MCTNTTVKACANTFHMIDGSEDLQQCQGWRQVDQGFKLSFNYMRPSSKNKINYNINMLSSLVTLRVRSCFSYSVKICHNNLFMVCDCTDKPLFTAHSRTPLSSSFLVCHLLPTPHHLLLPCFVQLQNLS